MNSTQFIRKIRGISTMVTEFSPLWQLRRDNTNHFEIYFWVWNSGTERVRNECLKISDIPENVIMSPIREVFQFWSQILYFFNKSGMKNVLIVSDCRNGNFWKRSYGKCHNYSYASFLPKLITKFFCLFKYLALSSICHYALFFHHKDSKTKQVYLVKWNLVNFLINNHFLFMPILSVIKKTTPRIQNNFIYI